MFKAEMTKRTKARQSMAEKRDRIKSQNEDQRGLIVTTGTPLWQRNGRKRHIQFKAGKMYVIDNMVHPDPRKGYICIDQDYEHVMHFCWMERDSLGTTEDDFTPDPYDSIFKRITKCTTGRVYVFKIRSTNQTYFFWMQESAEDRDSEICAKVNYLLNFPPPWMRFPHIACNLEVPHPPGDEASLYSSAEESDQPVESAIPHDMINPNFSSIENSKALLKILESELPGHSQPFKKKFASKADETSAQELHRPRHGITENISPDSVRPLTDGNNLNRLAEVLPILEEGKKGIIYDSVVKPNRFEDEINAFTETSVDDEISSDTNSEYTDAEEFEGALDDRKFPTSSNRNADGQGKSADSRGFTSGQNTSLSGCINNSLENSSSAKEPNFHFYHERQPGNAWTEDDAVSGYVTARPSVQFSDELMSVVGNDGSLDGDVAVMTTAKETENEKHSVENWMSATELNFHVDHKTQSNQPQKEGSVGANHGGACYFSTEPSVQSTQSLENWKSSNGPNLYPTCNEHEAGGNTVATQKNLQSTQAQIMCYEKTSNVDNKGFSLELWLDVNSTTQVSTWKESVSEKQRASSARENATNSAIKGAKNDPGRISEIGNIGSKSSSHSQFKCSTESLNKDTPSFVNESSSPGLQNRVFPKVMILQTALVGETWSEDPSKTKGNEKERNIEVTQTPEILESQNSSKSIFMYPTESRHNHTSCNCEGPSQELPVHVSQKSASLLTRMDTLITDSKLEDPSNFNNQNGKSEVGQAVEGSIARSDDQPSSSPQMETSIDGGLGKPPSVPQIVLCTSTAVGTTFLESTSTLKSQQPGCSAQEPVSSVTPGMANPTRSGCRGVDKESGTRSGKRPPPESHLAQPGCSKIPKSLLMNEKSRESIISSFSSKISALSSYSQASEGVDGDDGASKETNDLSNPESSILGGTEGVSVENRETTNKNNCTVGEVLDQICDTIKEKKSRNNSIAMILLSTSDKNANAVAKQANKSSRSSIHEIPLESAEMDGKKQANVETKLRGPKNIINATAGTSTYSRQGLESQESAKPPRDVTERQKASNRTVRAPKNSASKKKVAPKLRISTSLEEVISVSGAGSEEKSNLRKHPQQRVDVSLSGPIINASRDGACKRSRISSPGVPLPSPFRVPETSPVWSKRSRYPPTTGSSYLRKPIQEGRDARKRGQEEVDSPDSDEAAPPAKKSGILNANDSPSKSGASRPAEAQGLASGMHTPASGSSGSGSTKGRSLDRTSRVSIAKSASKGSPQTAEPSPRFNLRRRSDPVKTEDEQQTEPVSIREIKKTGPETRIRARTNPQSVLPRVQRVDRSIRDQSQNTRPVLIEDKKGSKSKTQDRKPSRSDKNPKL